MGSPEDGTTLIHVEQAEIEDVKLSDLDKIALRWNTAQVQSHFRTTLRVGEKPSSDLLNNLHPLCSGVLEAALKKFRLPDKIFLLLHKNRGKIQ